MDQATEPEHDAMQTGATSVSILHVASVPAIIRNFLIPYAAHFRALGWRVDAAAHGCPSVAAVTSAFDGVYDLPFTRSVVDLRSLIDSETAIRDLIRSISPDIVHVHTPIAAFVTRLAVRRMPVERRPAIAYTAHGFHFHQGGNPLANLAFLSAEKVAGRWTDRLIVINDEDEGAARRWRIVSPRQLVRMPGVGIDTAVYSPSQVRPDQIALVRQQLGIGERTPLFTSVAELHPRKRLDRAIEALSRMRNSEAHLAIAGVGPLRSRLESGASQLGVRERVHFLGFLEDVRPLLVASTAFVLSSGREGLARSVMEALALEVPVVASDARGNAELVRSDVGFVVPSGDPSGMAAAMDRLTAEPDLARSMGVLGRHRMEGAYGQQAVIDLHEQMYAAMLMERARRASPGGGGR
jgi:glycosyltransferase involved in cell wall biosynthesis